MSQFYVFNSPLSPDQIQTIYQNGLASDNTSLNVPTFSSGYDGSTERIVHDNNQLIVGAESSFSGVDTAERNGLKSYLSGLPDRVDPSDGEYHYSDTFLHVP